MARRCNGKRYLGNSHKMEVHDLDNEKTTCEIDTIKKEHVVCFATLQEAKNKGYDNCAKCIGGSKR